MLPMLSRNQVTTGRSRLHVCDRPAFTRTNPEKSLQSTAGFDQENGVLSTKKIGTASEQVSNENSFICFIQSRYVRGII
jgi:hypothetical protein